MLADRQYMRRSEAPRALSVTLALLVFNVVIFFLEYIDGPRSRSFFLDYGALSLEGLRHGYLWQFITFQFLHGGLPHLVLNSIGLYFFGRPLEAELGRREFIRLYLFSGVLGGIVQALLGLVSPRFSVPMVGASAGICGLLSAFALLAPESEVYIGFVLPVRARYLLPVMLILPVVLLVTSADSHVAHAAHFGGTLGGMIYLKYFFNRRQPLFHWARFGRSLPRRELVHTPTPKRNFWRKERSNPVDDLPPADFISREVDPILDKISAHGIQSLTDRERKILEAARAKMSKR